MLPYVWATQGIMAMGVSLPIMREFQPIYGDSWLLYNIWDNSKFPCAYIYIYIYVSGWWFGCHQFYFPILIGFRLSSQLTKSYFSEGWRKTTKQLHKWENHPSSRERTHIFQRGGPTTNQLHKWENHPSSREEKRLILPPLRPETWKSRCSKVFQGVPFNMFHVSCRSYVVWLKHLWIAYLVGGLEHFLFSQILGIIIPID